MKLKVNLILSDEFGNLASKSFDFDENSILCKVSGEGFLVEAYYILMARYKELLRDFEHNKNSKNGTCDGSKLAHCFVEFHPKYQ